MKRFLKYTLITLLALPLLAAAFLWGLYLTADMEPPAMTVDTAAYRVADHGGYTSCRGSFLRHNRYGLWELYTAGSPEESGAAAGALTAGLMRYQEQVFVDQIREFIPSDGYLKFLRGLIVIFNRNLGRHVPEEYRREIYARSLYCSHDFDAIGTPYERQLNYHAAHDIGHAMSQYMLVGCSSFAAWGGMSADGELVVGRNFDFYMGDDFARHKIVTFCRPQAGHPFVSIGWAGMIGVLSGMNDKGLTVTINAAKGPVPLSAATPISILARESCSMRPRSAKPSKSPAAATPSSANRCSSHRRATEGPQSSRRRPARPPCTKAAANTSSARTITSRPNWPATNTTSKTSPGRTAPAASHGWRS